MRQLINRYLFTCDKPITHRSHRGPGNSPCTRVEVVDAICEADADSIARQRGWRHENGAWVCTGIHQRKEAVA